MDSKSNYFWSSPKYKENIDNYHYRLQEPLYKNYAMIDGKVVEYDFCTNTPNHQSMLPDVKFLGIGVYHHSEKV